jgi:hypothetical protein
MPKIGMPPMGTTITLPEYTGGRLSPTQIDMYLRCPLQYYHRYVEGVSIPPGVALVEGSSHHAALELNNNYKVREHEDLSTPKIVERFEDEFSTRQKDIEEWDGETPESVMARGRGIIKSYLSTFAGRFQPDVVEKEFHLLVGAVPVIGYMDTAGTIQDNPRKVVKSAVDYKVAARAKSDKEVNESIQLGFYGWGLKSEMDNENGNKTGTVEAGFCTLKKTKTPSTDWQSTVVTPARFKWLRNIVTSVAWAIQCGVFPPCDPTNWCCDPKFCGYYHSCKGKYDK